MTKSREPALIEFLTNHQNVRCVLEILKNDEAIRNTLKERFWSGLSAHLAATMPVTFTSKFKWCVSSESNKKQETWAWLEAQFTNFTNSAQSLCYRIESYSSRNSFTLYCGLHWKVQTTDSSKPMASEKQLQKLRQVLEEDDYKLTEADWWCGWSYVRQCASLDDFLFFVTDNQQFVSDSISNRLWALVEHTIGHVEEINRSLKA